MREMKDSGIEWIGAIPKEWSVIRLCYLIGGYKAGPFGSALIMDKLADEGDILVYTPEIIAENRTDLPNNKYLQEERLKEMEQFVVQKDEIIFPIVGSLGRAMLITEDMPTGIINQRLSKFHLTSEVLFIDYFLWLFAKSSFYAPFIDVSCRGSIIVNLTKAILHDMPVIIPSIKEQKTISKYLDSKCLEIDSVISDIQSQIETLEEYKRSVITEAVTKGLDPDVEMKDSGVQWIGDIPAHWNMIPFKYILNERVENNYPVKSNERLSLSIGLGVTLYSEKTTNLDRFKDDVSQYKLAHIGDLVMNSMNVIVGAVGVTDYYGCISPAYYCFYDNEIDHVTAKYCEYIFLSKGMRSILYHLGKGIMAIDRGDGRVNTCRLKVSKYDINHLLIPVPSVAEQRKIVEFANRITVEIDSIIAEKKQQIETIEEYKKSLIFEYVTGKKEVKMNEC